MLIYKESICSPRSLSFGLKNIFSSDFLRYPQISLIQDFPVTKKSTLSLRLEGIPTSIWMIKLPQNEILVRLLAFVLRLQSLDDQVAWQLIFLFFGFLSDFFGFLKFRLASVEWPSCMMFDLQEASRTSSFAAPLVFSYWQSFYEGGGKIYWANTQNILWDLLYIIW